MKGHYTIKINFTGGIISPGDLYHILDAASKTGVKKVSFGLRQQLLIDVEENLGLKLTEQLEALGVLFEIDNDMYPNIVSSYPAEEVFIKNTWLSEGVYKDVFDGFQYTHQLKINISDSNQSFTPMLTGNINWVASLTAVHFWHLIIRFPKTNIVYEWPQMVYTNDIARFSKDLELHILANKNLFFDNKKASGDKLFTLMELGKYITQTAEQKANFPPFNLPYYEGLQRVNGKYWLGVYRRDELFSTAFLKKLCTLCQQTKIGQLCATPWKSIIVKGIEDKDKAAWSALLDEFEINMRHAANELNFQVEDNSYAARKIKGYIIKRLNNRDTRTFGLCIGIKTTPKSEVFSSILIKQKPLIKLFGKGFLHVYDILCAKDFNPNERTGTVFRKNIFKMGLVKQLHKSVIAFYKTRSQLHQKIMEHIVPVKDIEVMVNSDRLHQCGHCYTVYDSSCGEPESNIDAGTLFQQLADTYQCPLCEAPKTSFKEIERCTLQL